MALLALIVGLAIGCSEPFSPELTPSELSTTSDNPFVANSLLAGKTPANFTAPAGWTLVATQDFESGTIPGSQFFNPLTSIATTFSHSGARAAVASIAGNSQDVVWGISNVGSYSDLYFSWYDYKEPQGRMNDEFFLATVRTPSQLSDVVWDYYGYGSPGFSAFNATSGTLVNVGEFQTHAQDTTFQGGPGRQIQWGAWEQIEIWFHPNTPALPPGGKDGFFRVFINGRLVWEKVNINIVTDENYNSGGLLQIGGSYTKATWLKPDNSCGTFIGDGEDRGVQPANFNQVCTCANQCSPNPPGKVPIFKRYIDDIIVLKR